MKLLRSIIAFFADDLLSAGLVIAWVAVMWIAARQWQGVVPAAVYFLGIVAILAFGTWRRAR